MGFCSQCGRAVDARASLCTSCGAPRSPSRVEEGAPGGGPTGQTVAPGLVLVLLLVTLGFYAFFYWWRVSKQTDAYEGRPGHAHGKVKAGVVLLLAATALFVVAMVVFLSSLGPTLEADGTLDPEEAMSEALGGVVLAYFAGIVLAIPGIVLLLMGQWRVWRTIRDDETRRGVPAPLSPGLMLFFVLMPYVNIVTFWIAYWQTQKRLNGVWAAASAPSAYAPMQL